jgi:hypothetical protein
MTATDLASELQDHLLSVMQIAQEIVVSALETGVEQAQRVIPQYAQRLPEYAQRLSDHLPDAAASVGRAFERTEEWLDAHR